MSHIVLVSGWCMSADIMSPLADALIGEDLSVISMSLADARNESWDALLSALDNKVGEQPALLVGWSLGGNLCARYAAQYPDKVVGLVTMGSTPSFVAAEDWPEGKHPDVYQEFVDGVEADIQLAMKGFAPMCTRGSANLKATIRTLRASAQWATAQETNWQELLNRLAEDARPEWKNVTCPTVHLLADSDPLAKAAIAGDLKKLAPAHRVQVLSGSHAIFLDHTEVVVQTIRTIL